MLTPVIVTLSESIMEANVGGVDRVVRIVIGLAILSLFFVLDGPKHWWGLVGLVPLATGFIGWCPAYVPLGIRTRKAH
jgi:DUF2892 family protein